MTMDNPLRIKDKDGVYHYAFCDVNNDLVCLVCCEYIAPWGDLLDSVYEALDDDSQLYANKSDWNLAEWNTWYAFGLAPAIEIYKANEAYGIGDEVRTEWTWRRIQPC